MTTIKDVARHAECSIATVSYLLNDHPLAKRISRKTRERVLQVIKELNYVPNSYAKRLREGSVHTVGIFCSDIKDPFTTIVLHGIMNYLKEMNYFYHLVEVGEDLEILEKFAKDSRGYNIDCFIGFTNTLTFDAEMIAEMFRNTNLVSLARDIPQLPGPAILLDNEMGMRLGIGHLFELGHREIAFIFGPNSMRDAVIRREAAVKICQEYGIPYREALTATITNYSIHPDCSVEATRQILGRKVPFTALFAYDDWTAFGAIQELCATHYRVPGDISVIGFDDIRTASAFNPALTTIHQPLIEMGTQAAHLVVNLLANKNKMVNMGCNIFFKPELVIRKSTAPPRARPKIHSRAS